MYFCTLLSTEIYVNYGIYFCRKVPQTFLFAFYMIWNEDFDRYEGLSILFSVSFRMPVTVSVGNTNSF